MTAVSVPRPIADPYPDTTPTSMLNRSYNVSSTTWTAGMTPIVIPFPGCLMGIPTIANILKRYRFLRSDITVEIKLNSTPFHQGALIAAWLPCNTALPATTPSKLPFYLSGIDNHVIINAATQDSVKMTIPWLCPLDWFDSQYMATTTSTIIGNLYIYELNAVVATSVGQSASIPVNIFASFANPRVTGFTSDMNAPNTEAKTRASSGLDAKPIVSAVSKILRKVPVIGSAYGMVADVVNSFAGDLSKPTIQTAPVPYFGDGNVNYNQADGLTVAKELTLYHNSQLTTSPTFEGMKTQHIPVSELAQRPMLYAMTSLSSTNNNINIPVTVNTNYLSTPSYIVNPIGDWLTFVARAHKYWRGSIKYLIHVNVPSFYSFRARVTLRYKNAYTNLGDLQSTVFDIKGETFIPISVPYLYSTMYRQPASEFLGAIHPWLSITMETPIVGSTSLGAPFAYINIYRSGGEDTQFAQLTTLAGAVAPVEKPPPKATSDCSPYQEFAKPFKTLIDGVTQAIESRFTMTETTGTVADCMKRPSAFTPTSTYTPLIWTPGAANANYKAQAGQPFNYFAAVFAFRRGGIVFGKTQETFLVSKCTLSGTNSSQSVGDGIFYSHDQDAYFTPNVDSVVVPYFCNIPWVPNFAPGYNYSSEITTDIQNSFTPSRLRSTWYIDQFTMISAADDALFLFPIPNFPYYFGTTDFSAGFIPGP